jgi:hypothetical protein
MKKVKKLKDRLNYVIQKEKWPENWSELCIEHFIVLHESLIEIPKRSLSYIEAKMEQKVLEYHLSIMKRLSINY